MKDILDHVSATQGWQIQAISAVHGGDINQAFALETNQGKYFLKLNDAARYPKMFAIEAVGLHTLSQHFTLKVPTVIAAGEVNDKQYLLLEWLQPASYSAESWQAFGRALAQLHQTTNDNFGWHGDNYIGSLRVKNDWSSSWANFYTNARLLPMIKMLRDGGAFSGKEVQVAEAFCQTLPNRMPQEQPALVHGDLWNGNASAVMVNNKASVAIYDPAAFYGHREIDIALTRLFGGFPSSFYSAYEEVYPLQKGWQERLPIFQLCHLLLHAVLFGGGYVSRCREIMKSAT
jgi:protein-ribulosamine 3-kinase